jgi:hypothetical protein
MTVQSVLNISRMSNFLGTGVAKEKDRGPIVKMPEAIVNQTIAVVTNAGIAKTRGEFKIVHFFLHSVIETGLLCKLLVSTPTGTRHRGVTAHFGKPTIHLSSSLGNAFL